MKAVSSCVVCGEGNLHSRPAMTAPFLAKRIWRRAPFTIQLATCANCEFKFFNPRLESDDEQKLYSAYREDEYQKIRESCEPWYTKQFNARLSDPRALQIRRTRIAALLDKHLRNDPVTSILDFGGDRGELIYDLIPNTKQYVYDISQVTPVDGVLSCRDLEDCRRNRCDLIVCSNVLEHVGFPQELLDQIDSISHNGTLIFLEVPCESPFSIPEAAKRLTQQAILALSRPRIAASLLRPGLLYQMHEHVNFFSPRAFNRLVVHMGWQPVAEGVYESGGYNWGVYKLLGGRVAWSLARVIG